MKKNEEDNSQFDETSLHNDKNLYVKVHLRESFSPCIHEKFQILIMKEKIHMFESIKDEVLNSCIHLKFWIC